MSLTKRIEDMLNSLNNKICRLERDKTALLYRLHTAQRELEIVYESYKTPETMQQAFRNQAKETDA